MTSESHLLILGSITVPGTERLIPRSPVTILTTYNPDPTVVLTKPSNSVGMTVTKTFKGGTMDHFVMSNVTVVFNQSCASTLKVKTDVWASNANAANSKAQCYLCGT